MRILCICRGSKILPIAFVALLTPSSLQGAKGATLLDLLGQGGWPMAPIGLCLILTIYFIVSGVMATAQSEAVPREQYAELCILLAQGQVSEASRLLQADESILGRVMSPVLARCSANLAGSERQRMEELVQQALQTEQELIAQSINYLNVLSSLAPMLGLLGTVWGMIGAFQTISQGGMGNAQLMAGDISMGLITTAAGLIVAMPGVAAFWFLRNRLQRRCISVARAANLMLDCLERGTEDGEDTGWLAASSEEVIS